MSTALARDVARVTIGAGSHVLRLRPAGPLRILHPRAAGDAAWIVTSSLGGGLVDGDDVALEVAIEAGSVGLITTQSSTKVYRGTTRQRLSVTVHGDATALIVPDPVVPYRDAHFTQTTHVALDAEASVVLADTVTAGRVAFGERWVMARVDSTLRIDVAGEPLVIDRVVLDPAHGNIAARMRRFEAVATVVMLGPRVADLARANLAAIGEHADAIVVGSELVGGALFRIAGERVERTTAIARDLMREACSRLGEDPWSRKW